MARRTVFTSNFNRRAISFFGTLSTRCKCRISAHWDILITSASSWLGRRDDRVSPRRSSPGDRCFECSGGPFSSGHGVPFHVAATRGNATRWPTLAGECPVADSRAPAELLLRARLRPCPTDLDTLDVELPHVAFFGYAGFDMKSILLVVAAVSAGLVVVQCGGSPEEPPPSPVPPPPADVLVENQRLRGENQRFSLENERLRGELGRAQTDLAEEQATRDQLEERLTEEEQARRLAEDQVRRLAEDQVRRLAEDQVRGRRPGMATGRCIGGCRGGVCHLGALARTLVAFAFRGPSHGSGATSTRRWGRFNRCGPAGHEHDR